MSSENPRKWIGHCSVCMEEAFEIDAYYPFEHPLAGLAKKVGRPKKGTWRTSWILTDGTRVDLTICADCEITPENAPGVWRSCVEAMVWEAENLNRVKVGASALNSNQLAVAEQNIISLLGKIPLGEIYRQPWREVIRNG